MNMLEEKKRLAALIGTEFMEKATGNVWTVTSVSHNIYKDVVLHITNIDHSDKKRELIEGSEEYYKGYVRLGQCMPQ